MCSANPDKPGMAWRTSVEVATSAWRDAGTDGECTAAAPNALKLGHGRQRDQVAGVGHVELEHRQQALPATQQLAVGVLAGAATMASCTEAGR